MNASRQQIEQLEHTFWQSMVDNQPHVATGLLADTALMVSGHGAMSFDHAGYTRMANDPSHKLVSFELSDMDVLFTGGDGDVAIATYKVDQQVESAGKPMRMQAVDSSTWIRQGDAWKCVAHTESVQPTKQ